MPMLNETVPAFAPANHKDRGQLQQQQQINLVAQHQQLAQAAEKELLQLKAAPASDQPASPFVPPKQILEKKDQQHNQQQPQYGGGYGVGGGAYNGCDNGGNGSMAPLPLRKTQTVA
jgi:hypothetical protein